MSIDQIKREITQIGRANRAHREPGPSAANNEAEAASLRLIEAMPMFAIMTDSEALAVVDALATYLKDIGESENTFVPRCASNLRTYLRRRFGVETPRAVTITPAMAEDDGVRL